MGHRADSARSALGRTLLLLLGFIAACGPRPATEPGREATMLVVAVTGLRADDPLDQVTTGSLEALEKYTEAIALFDRGGDRDMMNALLVSPVFDIVA